MKVLVAVKRVVDADVKVRVRADGSGIDTTGVKFSMNPFDAVAVEEAVKLREAGTATEVVALSIGPSQAQDTLRTALAMGADRAILIESGDDVQPLAVAKLIAAVAKKESPDLILLGKQAIDDDSGQVGPMLAGLLGWGQASFAATLTLADGAATVESEADDGLMTSRLPLPCVVTTDLRLNKPRYASLPNIMKAKKKPLDVISLAEMGVDTAPRLTVLGVTEPPKRKAGVKVASVAELVQALKQAEVL